MATILRLKRTDKKNEFLLVQVSQTSSKSLDLKLVGTNQENIYHGGFKEANVKSLQANNFSGAIDEWKNIIKYAFLHERPADATFREALEGLETVAAITGSTLTITLRKNIDGITQRLGAVKLEHDQDREEISPFDWVDIAVASADELRSQLETLQASVSGQQNEVARLDQQLNDLVKAKKEHEDELLKKFAALLNSKKLKIRDQQRLLKASKIELHTAEKVEAIRSSENGSTGASRKEKRKLADEEDDDDQNADGDTDMDGEEARLEETPQHSDEEATDDDDRGGGGGGSISTKALAKKASQPPTIASSDELPPRRELPFAKSSASVPTTAPGEADEDDEETDDEL